VKKSGGTHRAGSQEKDIGDDVGKKIGDIIGIVEGRRKPGGAT